MDGPGKNGFENIHLIQDSVPELDLQEIDTSCDFLGKRISYPMIINALTGGTEQAKQINKTLAVLAGKYGVAMAVGSQTVAMEDPALKDSFSIVRQMNPSGVILANISASQPFEVALQVIEMIEADGLQLHFNIPQELAMREGDRSFRGMLENVSRIVEKSPVPVIAKEVGFGFSRDTVQKLFGSGIRYIDNGGKGGTNFLSIEKKREGMFGQDLENWGIPTAMSLAEIVHLQLPIFIVASGGIRNAVEAAKAIALGADMVGITGPFLKILLQDGSEAVEQFMERFFYEWKAVFLMCGAMNSTELKQKPLLITGEMAEWLRAREIDPRWWTQK